MYDYVLQLGFDKNSQNSIQEIRNHLRLNEILDRQRGWLPHITIDIYNCTDKDIFIEKINSFISNIEKFNVELLDLGNFEDGTLYLKPFSIDKLVKIKKIFDANLNEYMLEKRKNKSYVPHITLCTNNNLIDSTNVAKEIFKPMEITVMKIWMYDQKMNLIREWELM